uniref:Uncharacterized protein n=1 Tax=Arundo donax TaxID=35708 RepID=A0A0A9F3Q5_ARUDO
MSHVPRWQASSHHFPQKPINRVMPPTSKSNPLGRVILAIPFSDLLHCIMKTSNVHQHPLNFFRRKSRTIPALLSSENIHCKPVETADDCLLDAEAKAVKGSHCGQQDAWPTCAEHVDIDCMPFSHPDFNLNKQERC